MADKLNVGIAWYTPQQWTRVRAIAADPEKLEDSYREWLRMVQKTCRDLEMMGVEPTRVYLDPDELAQWCGQEGIAIDQSGRARFVQHKMEDIRSAISFYRTDSGLAAPSLPPVDTTPKLTGRYTAARERIEDYVCGGYFLAKAARSYRKSDLLPEALVTVSPCIATTLPGAWAFEWFTMRAQDREQAALSAGISLSDVERLIAWTADRCTRNEVGFPSLFSSKDVAHEFLQEFAFDRNDWRLLAIGLRREQVEDFLSDLEGSYQTGPGTLGIHDLIRRRESPDTTGRLIGFDVLAIAYDECHSWLCNSLEEPSAVELGIRPLSHGLLPDWSDANECAEYASRSEVGAELLPWYAWAVISYPIPRRDATS